MSSVADTPEQPESPDRPGQDVSAEPRSPANKQADTGTLDDEAVSRLQHDLDIANDWHPER